ncbi:hypothetical protein BGX24_009701 [Mortierella sp. AD032]|nr:hypothetical protein BGX24_009701 [Mortierella sp. AD032]
MANLEPSARLGSDVSLEAHSPDGRFIASCGAGDFTVKIRGLDLDNSYTDRVDFDDELECLLATKNHLFAGTSSGTVKHYDIRRKEYMGAIARVDLAVRCLAVSSNGRLLAIGTEASDIKIIDMEDIEQCWSLKGHKKAINCLAFDPLGTFLVDASGLLSTWNGVVDSEKGLPFGQPKPDPLEGLFDDAAVEDHAMQDEEMAPGEATDNESLSNFVVDDENNDYSNGTTNEVSTERRATTHGVTFSSASIGRHAMQPLKTLHPRFQSGSTSPAGQRRYLAFNLLGLITSVEHEGHCTVVVEFHDKVTSRGFRFTDSSRFSLAYLGTNGAIFAAPSYGDTRSTVFYKTHESSLSKSEWQIYLPPGEDVTAIALTVDAAIVATSRGYVRTFSQSGIQTGIYSVGSIVAVAGLQDLAIVIYHQGEPFEGSQNLGYVMYNVGTNQRIQRGSLPVSDDTTVTWLGFSEFGAPAFYDDSGVVHILNHYRRIDQGQWVPILDTAFLETTSDNHPTYWPVGLTDETLTCIKCRSGETEPSFPKPFVTELPLKMPTLYQDTDTGVVEEEWLRQKILLGLSKDEKLASSVDRPSISVARREIEMDKLVLKMVRYACQAGSAQKSLDLTAMLCNSRSVDSAVKIAHHYKLSQLTERLQKLSEIMARAEEDGRHDADKEKEKVMADDIIDTSSRRDERVYKVSSRQEDEEMERRTFQRKDPVEANDPFGRRVVKDTSVSRNTTATTNGGGSGAAAPNPFKKKAGATSTSAPKGFGNVVKETDKNSLPITRRATDVFEAADYLAADEQRSRVEKEKAGRQDDIFRKRKANGAAAMTSGGQKTLSMFGKQSAAGSLSTSAADAKRFKKQEEEEGGNEDAMMVEDDFLEDNGYEDREESFPPAAQVIPETQREEDEEEELFARSIEETRGHLAKTHVESSLSPERSSSSLLAGFKFNRS